jgi:hypothetical protein
LVLQHRIEGTAKEPGIEVDDASEKPEKIEVRTAAAEA